MRKELRLSFIYPQEAAPPSGSSPTLRVKLHRPLLKMTGEEGGRPPFSSSSSSSSFPFRPSRFLNSAACRLLQDTTTRREPEIFLFVWISQMTNMDVVLVQLLRRSSSTSSTLLVHVQVMAKVGHAFAVVNGISGKAGGRSSGTCMLHAMQPAS